MTDEKQSLVNQYSLRTQKRFQEEKQKEDKQDEEKQDLQENKNLRNNNDEIETRYSNKFISLIIGDKRIDLINPQYINKLEREIKEKDTKIQRLDKRISSLEDKIRRIMSNRN